MPERVTLSRAKGWKMPPDTVKVDRSTKWGNPYQFGMCHPDKQGRNVVMTLPETLVDAFRGYALRQLENNPGAFEELRGKNLACWCKPGCPCHGDVLLELANA